MEGFTVPKVEGPVVLSYKAPVKNLIEKIETVQYLTELDRRLEEMMEKGGPDFINALLDEMDALATSFSR